MFSSYFETHTHSFIYIYIHYIHLRDSFCLVGNLQRFFRSPRLPRMAAGRGRARIVMDIRLTGPRRSSASDRPPAAAESKIYMPAARSWIRCSAAVETLKTSVRRLLYIYIYTYVYKREEFICSASRRPRLPDSGIHAYSPRYYKSRWRIYVIVTGGFRVSDNILFWFG